MGTSCACLVASGEMGAWHVQELCFGVLDPTFGSMHAGDTPCADPVPRGGKDLSASEAVVPACFHSYSSAL